MKPLFRLGTLRKAKIILEKSIMELLFNTFGISLSYSEYLLLFYIDKNDGASQYALAKKMGVSTPMMSKMIGNLDYFDLIQIKTIEGHAMKKTEIHLSPRGIEVITYSESWVEASLTDSDLLSLARLEEAMKKLNSLL